MKHDETMPPPPSTVAPGGVVPGGPVGDVELVWHEAVAALPIVDPEAYELRGEIARGGMGRIFQAWDRRHGRRVALKMMLRARPDLVVRFVRELRVTARLVHPAVVTLFDAGRWPSGEPFFAMQLVSGRPLSEAAADARTTAERLRLLPRLIAACEGVAHAHDQGIVHRDLKPANVLVGEHGETVVIDWGLARQIDGDDRDEGDGEGDGDDDGSAAPRITATGRALGTPCFMPPEQAAGAPATRRSDVYALGATAYDVLGGGAPHAERDASAVLELVRRGVPHRPLGERAPDLPADLVAIVEKAMARAPADRYPDAGALAADLAAFAAGAPVRAHTYGAGELGARWLRRHRVAVAAIVALAVGSGAAGGLALRRVFAERDRATAARIAADRARAEVELERRAAAELATYLVRDLRQRLGAIGRLDLFDELQPLLDGKP